MGREESGEGEVFDSDLGEGGGNGGAGDAAGVGAVEDFEGFTHAAEKSVGDVGVGVVGGNVGGEVGGEEGCGVRFGGGCACGC